jgi:FixJ family two-component response regulator
LNPEQKTALARMARQRSLLARLVERARIVLRTAVRLENRQIAAQMGIMPEKVARLLASNKIAPASLVLCVWSKMLSRDACQDC